MSDGIVRLTMCRLQRESPGSGIDRTRAPDGASWHQCLVWVRHDGLVARQKFVDLRQSFRISAFYAAIPGHSHDFQSNPLVASCGGKWAFWIH
jgi:hypothetical protein